MPCRCKKFPTYVYACNGTSEQGVLSNEIAFKLSAIGLCCQKSVTVENVSSVEECECNVDISKIDFNKVGGFVIIDGCNKRCIYRIFKNELLIVNGTVKLKSFVISELQSNLLSKKLDSKDIDNLTVSIVDALFV